jgi:hypothetical protein
MKTITIDFDLPDNVTLPSNWDARSFVLEKMYEEGLLASGQASLTDDESDGEYDADSWLTPEMQRQAKENRRRLEEEARRNPPKRTKEEMIQLLINLPMPDEETIKRQDEVREHRRQWTSPWER